MFATPTRGDIGQSSALLGEPVLYRLAKLIEGAAARVGPIWGGFTDVQNAGYECAYTGDRERSRVLRPLLFCQAAARTEVVCGVVRAWNTASEIRRLTIRRASIVPSPWLILRW